MYTDNFAKFPVNFKTITNLQQILTHLWKIFYVLGHHLPQFHITILWCEIYLVRLMADSPK